MKIDLHEQHKGAVKLILQPAESFYIRQQGLLAMSSHGSVRIGAPRDGICTLINGTQPNEFWLAGRLPGDASAIELQNQELLVQGDAFLGAHSSLRVKPTTASKQLSAQVWFRIQGQGTVLLSALGTIYPLQMDSEYIINSAYIVAYSKSLKFIKVPMEGENHHSNSTAAHYTFFGKGVVWCQTHHPQILGALLAPQLKKRQP